MKAQFAVRLCTLKWSLKTCACEETLLLYKEKLLLYKNMFLTTNVANYNNIGTDNN